MDSFDSGFDRWPERRLPLSIVGVKEITNLQWISGLFGLRGFHILELSVVKHTHTHADFVSLPKAPAVPHRLRKKQQQLRVSFICLSRGGKNKGNEQPRMESQGNRPKVRTGPLEKNNSACVTCWNFANNFMHQKNKRSNTQLGENILSS